MPSDLRVGYALRDISPSIGDPHMIGNRIERIAKPVHGRVIFIDPADGDGPLILAMADHAGFDRLSDRLAREAMAEATGVAVERIRINGSHNHTCPEACRTDQALLDSRGLQHVNTDWVEACDGWLAAAAAEAQQSARPASAWCGTTPIEGIGANRVIKHADGQRTTRLGYTLDEGLRKTHHAGAPGLMDPDAQILCFRDETDRPIATIVNYACHVTAAHPRGTVVHPDYPGIAMDHIEEHVGGGGFFLQGCGGTIGTGKYADGTMETVERMGRGMGEAVVQAMDDLRPASSQGLRFQSWQEKISLRDSLPTADELRRCLAEAPADSGAWQIASMLRVVQDKEAASTCALFLIMAADWCLAGMPAESSIEQQLAIRGASSRPFTFVAGYYDTTLWYIPSHDRIRSGGYESSGDWAYTAPGVCEQLAASVIRRLWD